MRTAIPQSMSRGMTPNPRWPWGTPMEANIGGYLASTVALHNLSRHCPDIQKRVVKRIGEYIKSFWPCYWCLPKMIEFFRTFGYLLTMSYHLCWVGPFLSQWPSCHLLSVVLPFHWGFKLKATIRAESLFDKAITLTDNRKMFCYVAAFFTKLYHVLLNEFSNSSNHQMFNGFLKGISIRLSVHLCFIDLYWLNQVVSCPHMSQL